MSYGMYEAAVSYFLRNRQHYLHVKTQKGP